MSLKIKASYKIQFYFVGHTHCSNDSTFHMLSDNFRYESYSHFVDFHSRVDCKNIIRNPEVILQQSQYSDPLTL